MTKIDQLVKYSHLLYERKYVIASDGNLSIRMKNGILVTPTGFSKEDIKKDDLILVDLKGNVKNGKNKPSMETGMHLKIYRKNPKIKAVIHAHPVNILAYSLINDKIDLHRLPEAKDNIRFIGYVNYFPAGSVELANAVSKEVKEAEGIIIMKKHGIISFGKDITNCFFAIERLEFFCNFMLKLRNKGKILNNFE